MKPQNSDGYRLLRFWQVLNIFWTKGRFLVLRQTTEGRKNKYRKKGRITYGEFLLEDTGMKTIQELQVIAEGHEDYEMHMEAEHGGALVDNHWKRYVDFSSVTCSEYCKSLWETMKIRKHIWKLYMETDLQIQALSVVLSTV